ncbi:MAG: hypothetical protein ACJA1A_003582 [Saprospiraceae bacterium]|jgi:hypothetical protein
MKRLFIFLLTVIAIAPGCYENIDNTPANPDIIIQTTEVYVTTRISGSAENQQGETISDYYINVNDIVQDIPSDYFLIELDKARKKGQTIRVSKDGNQIGLRTELLVENDINHINIKTHEPYITVLKEKSKAEVQINKDLTAVFTDTQFDEINVENINITYIDINPSIKLTPVGYNKESHLLAIDSKGGFYLTASDESSKSLNVKPDSQVNLIIGDLEEGINGLFVLTEETDIWVLVSDVSANTEVDILAEGYYTFGKYTKGVFVEGVITKDAQKVAYQPMQWTHNGLQNDICATEYGRWIALLPEKETVALELLNPCDESLQSESIVLGNNDLNNQDLAITNSESYQYLNTNVIDCEGNTVTNSSINITSINSDNHYVFSQEGQERWIAVCGDFTIAAYDETTAQTGTEISWSSNLNETIDILSICPEFADGFSYFKIRNDEKAYPAFDFKNEGGKTILSAKGGEIKVIFSGNEVGIIAEDQIHIVINDSTFGANGYYVLCENSPLGCGISNFQVTHYDIQQNGQVRVKFSGKIWMQTLNPTLAGTYPIEGIIVSKIQ